ncbi:toll/interleukin-1 receptor domain-containing protein [Aeromonas salmonicida]
MEGMRFVSERHIALSEGCFLPGSFLLGQIQNMLHDLILQNPGLKNYIPDLIDVDLFVFWNGDMFIIFISPDKKGHIPARGMDTKYLPTTFGAVRDIFNSTQELLDMSDFPWVIETFAQLNFTHGFAAAGFFKALTSNMDEKLASIQTANRIANLILNWARKRQQIMENSKIFLSHKGINKPLVREIDKTLRILNLKTWFDIDDLKAGDPLISSIDQAFQQCSAAVFFISDDFKDYGVIKMEIEKAMYESITREESFKIIPLVLTQHGGTDVNVPHALQTLTWKHVSDVQIVPTILSSLPISTQSQIAYNPSKF